MDIKKLVTLSFDRNVGTLDRIFRLLSGAVLGGAGWYLSLPHVFTLPLSALGAAWFATGILSKCSIYYMLGYSTCPISGRPARGPS